jgi:hypothetical protein
MANSIKYSTTGDTQSLKKGNLFFGVGDVGKGPSSVTQHFNGVTPMGGGYTIYFYDPRQPNNIGYDPISSDVQLIRYTNGISGQNFTGATQCFNWYATQTNYTCVNEDYDGIVTSGLTLNLDAGFLPSYPTSGNTWYDLSYSGNNGTLINGVTYSALEGGSLVFDGVNDTVSFPAITLGSTYTITQTLVASASNNNIGYMPIGGGIVNSGSTYTGYVWFTTNPAGSTTSIVFNQNGETGGFSFTLPTPLPQYTLFQYTLVKNSSTANFYINGTLLTTQSVSSGANFTVRNLGWSYSSYYMNRNLYSTQIYNRALSAAEVQKNYNAGLARFNTPNIVKSNLLLNLDSSNTVSYPTSGTTWTDLSGNGYNGTLTNGPTFDSTSKSIVFDGVDDYALSNSNVNITGNNPRTFECWVYVAQSTSKSVMGGGTQTNGTLFDTIIWNQGGYLRVIGHYYGSGFDTASTLPSRNTINLNAWNHIIHTYDGSTSSIYTNGVFSNSGTFSLNTGNAPVKLGTGNYTGGYNYFQGNGTVLRVYKQSFTLSDVLQNYYQSPIVTDGLVLALDAGNLVSYSGAGTTWKNLSLNSGDGSLINGTTFSGVSGGAIVFDGTDDVVTGTTTGSTFTGDFTQTAWIYKLNNNQIWQGVFTNSSPATNNTYLMTFGNGSVAAPYNSIGVNQVGVVESGVFLDIGSHLNRWLYVAISKVGSTLNIYCFKDGNLLSTTGTITWNGGNFATTNNYQIGRHWAGGSVIPFQGLISNVSLYNRALSADEIAQNFNAQKSRFGL